MGEAAVWSILVAGSLSVTAVLGSRPVDGVTSNFTNVALSWGEIVAGAVAAAWLLSVARRRPPGPRRGRPIMPAALVIAAATVLATAWIGVPWAADPPLAGWNAVRLTLAALVALVAADVGRADRLAPVAVAVVAVHGVVAVGQVAVQHSLGLDWLGERYLAPGVAESSTLAAADGSQLLRAYGLAGSPNILGGLLAIVLVVTAAAPTRWPWARPAVAAAWVGGAVVLLLTFSRGALLGLIGGLLLLVALLLRTADRARLRSVGVRVALGAMAVVPLIAAFGPFVVARAAGVPAIPTEVRSIEERVVLARQSLLVLADRPVLGTGIGMLPIAVAETFPESAYGRAPAHLVPLAVAAEIGLIGGAAYVALTVAPIAGVLALRRRPSPQLAIATAGLAVVGLVGLVDYYPWGSPIGRIWTWALLGMWAGAWTRTRSGAA